MNSRYFFQSYKDLETDYISSQIKVLRQLITAAFIDQVAIRKDLVRGGSSTGTKYATSKGVEYRAMGISEDAFIHPSSVIADAPPPDYIVYHEAVRTSRLWLKGFHFYNEYELQRSDPASHAGVTVINPTWLSSLGKASLCTFSKPIKNSANMEMVIPRFGPERWELPAVKGDVM